MSLLKTYSNFTGPTFFFTSLTGLVYVIKPIWAGEHTLAFIEIEAREALFANSFQFSLKFIEDTKLVRWDHLRGFHPRDGDSIQTTELQFI